MLLGSAVHAFILEPKKNEFMRGLPSKMQRKAWAEMEEKAAEEGKILLKEGIYDQAKKLAEVALHTNTDLQDFIKHKNFLPEVSVFGECENTGLSIKCRPDGMLLNKKLKTATLMDIKTTTNVSPTGFAKEIKKLELRRSSCILHEMLQINRFECRSIYLFCSVQRNRYLY